MLSQDSILKIFRSYKTLNNHKVEVDTWKVASVLDTAAVDQS